MKILLVEDNPDHRELIEIALKAGYDQATITSVASGVEAEEWLYSSGDTCDLVLLDYSLPGKLTGLNLLQKIGSGLDSPPVIMITGQGDERVATQAIKAGAYDYIVKDIDYLSRLPVVMQRAIESHRLKIERQRALDQLKESEERYRNLVKNAPTGILTIDLQGNIMDVNPKLLEILGAPSAEETRKINFFEFEPLIQAGISEDIQSCIAGGIMIEASRQFTSHWGVSNHLRYHLMPIRDANQNITGVQANVVNITKQVQAQQALETLNVELEDRVAKRTHDLNIMVNAMAGREVRMAELKKVIKKLRTQLKKAGLEPIADDPLLEVNYSSDTSNDAF